MISFDSPDLVQLFQDIASVPDVIDTAVYKVIENGAVKVKEDARKRFVDLQARSKYHGYLKHYARSITYDIQPTTDHNVTAEIGPVVILGPTYKTGNQGAYGPGVEFGSSVDGRVTPPMPHLFPAMEAQDGPTVDWIAKVAFQIVAPDGSAA